MSRITKIKDRNATQVGSQTINSGPTVSFNLTDLNSPKQASLKNSPKDSQTNLFITTTRLNSNGNHNPINPSGSEVNNTEQKMYMMNSMVNLNSSIQLKTQRGNSLIKTPPSNTINQPSTEILKNKENLSNPLFKIFFNSPRFKPAIPSDNQINDILKPSNHDIVQKQLNEETSSNKMFKTNLIVQSVINPVTMSPGRINDINGIQSNKQSNKYQSGIKQSYVQTKNINLMDNSYLNSSPAQIPTFKRHNLENSTQSSSQNNPNMIETTSKPMINTQLPRSQSAENSSLFKSTIQTTRNIPKQKDDSILYSSNQVIYRNIDNLSQKNENNYQINKDSQSQKPITKIANLKDAQLINSMSQSKFTTKVLGSKKLLGASSISLKDGEQTSKVNTFVKQFQNQPSSKPNMTIRNVLSAQTTIPSQKVCDEEKNCEQKKLFDKLNFLENKIAKIKTVEQSDSKTKEDQNNQTAQNTSPLNRQSQFTSTPNIKYHPNQVNERVGSPNAVKQGQETQSNILKVNTSPQHQVKGLSSLITQVNISQSVPFLQKQLDSITNLTKNTNQEQIQPKTINYHQNYASLNSHSIQTSSGSVTPIVQPKKLNDNATSQPDSLGSAFKSLTSKNSMNSHSSKEIYPNNQTPKNSLLFNQSSHNQQHNIASAHQPQQLKNTQKLYYVSSIIQAYSQLENQSVLSILAREHLLQTMQSIQFSQSITVPTIKQIESKRIEFSPLKEHKKTLIFDLDETLIHCNDNCDLPSDVIIQIQFPTGELVETGINVRPYAVETLSELSKIYEIVVFTASHSCYANVVLNYLDPENKWISYRLFREHCVQTEEGVYVKDLRVIINRNISDMLIVDNAAYSFGFQLDNGLPIIPFYDNKQDNELKFLITYMKSIQYVRDIREVNKKLLKISNYINYSDPQALLLSLYPDLH